MHFDRGHQSWICHILCVKSRSVINTFEGSIVLSTSYRIKTKELLLIHWGFQKPCIIGLKSLSILTPKNRRKPNLEMSKCYQQIRCLFHLLSIHLFGNNCFSENNLDWYEIKVKKMTNYQTFYINRKLDRSLLSSTSRTEMFYCKIVVTVVVKIEGACATCRVPGITYHG